MAKGDITAMQAEGPTEASSRPNGAVHGGGGRLYALALVISAIFGAALFYLRADKIFFLPADIMQSSSEDLRVFWRAGQFALNGDAASIYDQATLIAGLPENGAGLRWLNPPHTFFFFLPLGLVDYATAKLLFLIASVAAFAQIARVAAPRAPLLAAASLAGPAAFISFLVLQIGPFMLLLLLGALLLADRRPLLAGVLLAVLTIKPQYGLMAPLFLAARGDWRAFASAAAASIGLMALSAAVFGVDAWRQFFAALASPHASLIHRDMVTAAQAAAKLGAGDTLRLAAQTGAFVVAAGAVYFVAKRCSRVDATAVTLLASAVAAPSFWVYDFVFISAAFMALSRRGPWPLTVQAAAAFALFAPLIPLGVGTSESSLATTAALLSSLIAAVVLVSARRSPSPGQPSAHSRSGATRMTAFPKFSPLKRPRNASGALSMPS